MTTTNTINNGSTHQRKTLSGQLDRLDNMLDGLDQAIPAAVADAVRVSVTVAISEAVRTTLLELISNPEIIHFMRTGTVPSPSPSAPSQAQPGANSGGLTSSQQIGQSLKRAWLWSKKKVVSTSTAIFSPVRVLCQGVVDGFREINRVMSLKRPILIALGVGVAVGITGYASAPWLAGVLSGIGDMGVTLAGHMAVWGRRVLAHFPLS
jgi:hypothetical protein